MFIAHWANDEMAGKPGSLFDAAYVWGILSHENNDQFHKYCQTQAEEEFGYVDLEDQPSQTKWVKFDPELTPDIVAFNLCLQDGEVLATLVIHELMVWNSNMTGKPN